MSIHDIILGVIAREGDYVNNPNDRGGPTRWGITQAVARDAGWAGDMRDLPQSIAYSIYMKRYVIAPGFDGVSVESPLIAEELVDTGVNCGPSMPAHALQQCLNVLNQGGKDIAVDGKIGPATIGALQAFLRKRGAEGEKVMLRMLNCLQGAYYITITEARPKNEDFIYGWFLNRVEVK